MYYIRLLLLLLYLLACALQYRYLDNIRLLLLLLKALMQVKQQGLL
jgi:hypothetical protein